MRNGVDLDEMAHTRDDWSILSLLLKDLSRPANLQPYYSLTIYDYVTNRPFHLLILWRVKLYGRGRQWKMPDTSLTNAYTYTCTVNPRYNHSICSQRYCH